MQGDIGGLSIPGEISSSDNGRFSERQAGLDSQYVIRCRAASNVDDTPNCQKDRCCFSNALDITHDLAHDRSFVALVLRRSRSAGKQDL
jgi:hypothetical protein